MSELKVDTIAGSNGTTVTIKTGHTLTLAENMNAGSNKITNVTDPTSAQDVATKAYVDTQLLTIDTLNELTDVTITSVADNEVLAYDSFSSEWINQTASEAGLATSGDLTTHTSDTSNPHSVTVDQVFTTVPTGNLDINSNKLTNVTDPSSAQDAATKNYVDTQVQSKDQLSELSGTSDDVSEGSTNLYHTTERVQDVVGGQLVTNGSHTGISFAYDDALDGAIDATISLSGFSTSDLSEGTNLYYTNARFDTQLATKDTADLAEGTNLYYTDERVDDRFNDLFQDGTGLTGTYDDVADTYTLDLDLNSLTSATINVANDSLAIIDADDSNATRKETIADLVSAIAGANLTASNGQINAGAGFELNSAKAFFALNG